MQIDYKKLGYRWRGPYSETVEYEDKDVVYKDGAAFAYERDTQSFKIFARGQVEAISKGEIIVGGDNTVVSGFPGEFLYVRNGEVNFEHPYDRNGTKVKALSCLPKTSDYGFMGNCGNTWHNHHYLSYLMWDGSVRGFGWNNSYGVVGQGTKNNDHTTGDTTPTRINFPRGTPPIVKTYTSHAAIHCIDRDGTLWAAGHKYHTGAATANTDQGHQWKMMNMNERTPIGDEKVKELFHFAEIGKWGYDTWFALCESGKVFSWGQDNPHGIQGRGGGTRYQAALIPFTADHPIKKISSDGYYVTGMIDEDDNLWTVGHAQANFLGYTTHEFKPVLFLPDKVHEFSAVGCARHSSNHNYYAMVGILFKNGDFYQRSDSHDGESWGSPGAGWSYSFLNSTHKTGQNISNIWFGNGAWPIGIARTKDGRWLYRGPNRYNQAPWPGNNCQPTGPVDWDTNPIYQLDNTYWNDNIKEFTWYKSNIQSMGYALTKDGRVWTTGANHEGWRGLGHTSSPRVGEAPDDNWIGYDNAYYPLANDKAISATHTGYIYHNYGGTTQPYFSFHVLTDKGDVYASGAGYAGVNGQMHDIDIHVPNKIIF